MKKNIILIGDKIITKKTAECGEGKKGIIICQHEENDTVFGVKFNFENSKFHKLKFNKKHNGILNEKNGLWLSLKDFTVISEKDETKRKFNNMMFKGYIKTLDIIPNEIERSENIIRSCKNQIAERNAYNKENEKEIKKEKTSINKLKKQTNPEIENYYDLFNKLKKHKNIKDIIIDDNYIIIQTNDLIYHHKDDTIADFNIGAFYLFIPTDYTQEIKAINYKKQYNRGKIFHPCIKEEGYICTGDNVRKEIYGYLRKNQLLFLVYLLINFIKEPNYETPYLSADTFRCAQEVTYKPKKITNYLNYNLWYVNEVWNQIKEYQDIIKNCKKDIKLFKLKNIHSELINGYKARIRIYTDYIKKYENNNPNL